MSQNAQHSMNNQRGFDLKAQNKKKSLARFVVFLPPEEPGEPREPAEDMKFDTNLIKQLTGGDQLYRNSLKSK